MGKYAEDARQLLLLVGGKENVQKERTVPISRASIISDWIHAAKV